MRAEIITIGDELLDGTIIDANAAFVASRLCDLGIQVKRISSVGDDSSEIVKALRRAVSEMEMVVVSGGLGPTTDDITTVAVAEAFNRHRVFNEEAFKHIKDFFEARGLKPSPNNEKQAWIPEGAMILPNSVGTAPGYTLEFANSLLFFLPGVPHEMQRMLEDRVIPIICEGREGLGSYESRIFRVFGIPESEIDVRLTPIMGQFPDITFHSLPDAPEVTIKLTRLLSSENKEEGRNSIKQAALSIRKMLKNAIFATDTRSIAEIVKELLQIQGKTLSAAESMTGGHLGNLFTDIPDSSNVFMGGTIAYTALAKQDLLGVPKEIIEQSGTVSEATTKAMVQGIKDRLKTDVAVAITGFAGPKGGTEENPIGTTFIAVSHQNTMTCQKVILHGDRERIKRTAAKIALHHVRLCLE